MKHRHQLKLTNPKQTYLALQALEFSSDNVLIETPVIYFMQVDAVRLFYYLENRLTAKLHSYARKKLLDDQDLLYEHVYRLLIDEIFLWTWAYAKVPIEVEQTGCTPVLALTCGESSPTNLSSLRAKVASEGSAKTKLLLVTMRKALRNQGSAGRLLRRDIEEILEGL